MFNELDVFAELAGQLLVGHEFKQFAVHIFGQAAHHHAGLTEGLGFLLLEFLELAVELGTSDLHFVFAQFLLVDVAALSDPQRNLLLVRVPEGERVHIQFGVVPVVRVLLLLLLTHFDLLGVHVVHDLHLVAFKHKLFETVFQGGFFDLVEPFLEFEVGLGHGILFVGHVFLDLFDDLVFGFELFELDESGPLEALSLSVFVQVHGSDWSLVGEECFEFRLGREQVYVAHEDAVVLVQTLLQVRVGYRILLLVFIVLVLRVLRFGLGVLITRHFISVIIIIVVVVGILFEVFVVLVQGFVILYLILY